MEIYSAPSAQVIYQQFRKTCLPRRATRINRAVPCVSSRDSLDWKDYGISSIIDTVTNHKHLGNGSIILCHNGAKYTAEALDTLITSLKDKGYELVKISDLIYRDNYTMDVEGRQIPGAKGASGTALQADH